MNSRALASVIGNRGGGAGGLDSSVASPSGIVISRHVREGEVRTGSFELP